MMTVSLYNCGHCKLPQLVGQRCHCRTEDDDDTQVYKRPWVGLTDEQIHGAIGYKDTREMYLFARSLEKLLKDQNT
jgi:hypothetical protein